MGYYWRPETDSRELRGRPLRYLLVRLLSDAENTMTVAEMIRHCVDEGVEFEGRASKIISDALRWETRSGRVRRVSRGVYVLHRVPRSTMRWINRRVAQLRIWLAWQNLPSAGGIPRPPGQPTRASRDSWVPPWPYWPIPELPPS